MEGKTVFISGASSGLGAHFTKVLANAGAKAIVMGARRIEKMKTIAETVNRERCKVVCVQMDVANVESIRNAFIEAERAVGSIDVLINCAGIGNPKLALDMRPNDFDSVIRVNLRGAFFVAQEMCRRLVKHKIPGNIVMISSIIGLRPSFRQVNYAAAKAALLQVTKVMAAECFQHRIRINALCPGYFATEMTRDFLETPAGRKYIARIPPRRLGRLEELNGPLLLLASDASSFMTGTHIVVDLGHTNASL
eukprot:g242.t1